MRHIQSSPHAAQNQHSDSARERKNFRGQAPQRTRSVAQQSARNTRAERLVRYNKKHRATMFSIAPLRPIAPCAAFNPRRTPLIRATRHCVSTPPVRAIPTHPTTSLLSFRPRSFRPNAQPERTLFVRAPSATLSGKLKAGRRLPRPPYRASSRTFSARLLSSGLSKRFSGAPPFRRATDFSRF